MPKRCKRNNINGDLHRVFKIDSDFDAEVSIITQKYLEAGYPVGFIKSVISGFKKKDTDSLFEERRKICLNYLIALEMSMKLKDLLIKLKPLLEVK